MADRLEISDQLLTLVGKVRQAKSAKEVTKYSIEGLGKYIQDLKIKTVIENSEAFHSQGIPFTYWREIPVRESSHKVATAKVRPGESEQRSS